MSQVRRIARNTLVVLLGNLAVFAFGFFFTIYVARYLGAKDYGILAFALSFTSMFSILSDLGLQTLLSREIARDKTLAPKYISNVGALKLFLNVVVFGLIALVVTLLHYPSQTTFVVYLAALSMVFTSLTGIFYGVFWGNEKMEYTALGQVVVAAINLGGALYVIRCGQGVAGMAAVYAVGSLAGLLLSFTISTLMFARPQIQLDRVFLTRALREAWPFALGTFLFSVYYWTDTVVISFMKGDDAVGWYNAAYKLVSVLAFIPMAYFTAIFPVMSRLHVSSHELLRFTYERSMKYMTILGVPIAVGTTLLADRLIARIFGADFSSSVLALQILVWALVLQFAGGVFQQLFYSTNRQGTATLLAGVTALANLILDLVLTPIYSLYGTAAATTGNAALFLVLAYFVSSRSRYGLSPKGQVKTLAQVAVASIAMAFFVIHFHGLSVYVLIPVGALVYFAVLGLVGGIDKEDRLLIRQLLRTNNPDSDQSQMG